MKVKRVSIQWVRSIVRAAEACGVSRGQLLGDVNLTDEALAGTFGFIPLSKTVEIWRAAERLSGDPYFGLRMGERVRPNYLSIVAFTMMNCANFAEALAHARRYQRLISEGGRVELRLGDPHAAIVYLPQAGDVAFSRHQIEAVLVVIVGFARWLIAEEVTPVEVRFAHPEPSETLEHQRLFRCPLVFGADEHAIVLEQRWLEVPLPESDPSLLKIHTAQADQRLSEMDASSLPAKVSAILDGAGHFEWTRDHMARRLSMSRRTLQRKLAHEQTTFQALFDDYRHRAALTLLMELDVPCADVGTLIGFSEPSTFYRAFKRWEDVTPGEYRQKMAADQGLQPTIPER